MKKMFITNRCNAWRKLLSTLCILSVFTLTAIAQHRVSGTVTDASGEAVIGANIVEKGVSGNGTITDMDGNFSLSVKPGATLSVSFIGFATQDVAAGNKSHLDIVLRQDALAIEEVVVVAYGAQKKVNLTGSVSSIGATKLENRSTPNLSSSLAGLATGVTVRQSSGNPGNERTSIRVRGLGTFSDDYRSPMVIVDGIEGNMDAVNPNDVETVSILKDAASAAIYGSRAANGVILITTKKGNRNTTNVTYSGMLSTTQPSTRHEFLYDYAEHMDLLNIAQRAINPDAKLPYSQEEVNEWRAAKDNPDGMSKYGVANWLAYPNTDWADVLFENFFSQNHNLSLSGGNEKATYLLSAGLLDNPGVMQNTGLKRYQMRINLESQVTKFLKIGTQTFASRQDKQVGDQETALTYLYQTMAGAVPYYDGKYGGQTATDDPSTTNNMLVLLNNRDGNQLVYRLNTAWYASVKIMDGLTADAKFNYQMVQDNEERWPITVDRYNFRTGLVVNQGAREPDGTAYRKSNEEYRTTSNFLLNYLKDFGDHSINGLLGVEQMYYNYKGFNATKKGLLDMSIHDITTASDMQTIGGEYERDYAMLSWFGRINYSYRNRYLIEANFRRDASSRFSPDNRWGTFPSISAGWRVLEEPFAESLKSAMQNLKLRASWGKLGNTTSGYYDWQATYARQNNSLGGAIANGLAVGKISNPLLQWENITASEIGLEASFLKNRLILEANLYDKLTKGILTSPAIYATMGIASAPTKNTADMRNRGVEMSLTWNDRINDFQYSATVNFSYNQNEVVKYLGQMVEGWEKDSDGNDIYKSNIGQTATIDGNNIRTEGHPYNEYFLRTVYKGSGAYNNSDGTVNPNGGPKDGMIRTPEDMQWVKDMIAAGYSFNGRTSISTTGLNYGELIMADVNGDKNYGNSYDRVFTGKSDIPKYSLGFTANASWKGFDLSMTWAGNFGMYYYLRERGINQNNVSMGNVLPAGARSMFYYFNEKDPSDPNNNINAAHPRMLYSNDGTYVASDFYLFDASYFKLKFLQFGYTVPKPLTSKLMLNKVRLFVSGENLLTFTGYPGMDPEIGGTVNVYPLSRVLSGGLNITF
ncbi:MAG: TonB-dependent receptor [Tannerellaceae bacterium]|nr:TonB-dependent receptor [Tannerellaceae bacterium]